MARKMTVIPEWKRAWRFASIRLSMLGVFIMTLSEILGATWSGLPPSLQDKIPHASTIALVLFALSIIGRVLKTQEKQDDPDRES